MGFSEDNTRNALKKFGHDEDLALNYLLAGG
jgi:hypothetical protein